MKLNFCLSFFLLFSICISAQTTPIANDDFIVIEYNEPFLFDPTINDEFSSAVTIVSFTEPVFGMLELEDGITTMLYFPSNYYGGPDDIVEYTIEDEFGQTATATIFFQNVSGGILINDDFFETENDDCVSFNVLLNDFTYYLPLELSSYTQPQFGTLTYDTLNNFFEYCPDGVFIGFDSFTYEVNEEEIAIVTIILLQATIPNAVNDSVQTNINQFVIIDVLANDEFISIPVIADLSNPENGTVTVSAINSIIYTPNANFIGTDCFEYAVLDTVSLSFDVAQVCVEVVGGVVNVYDQINLKDLAIYPNPTSDFLNFTLDNPSNFQLYNSSGELIKKSYLNNLKASVNVSEYPSGIYYLNIENQILKFIKH